MTKKDAYFCILGYSCLFTIRGNLIDKKLETQGTRKMTGACAKLYMLDNDKDREVPYWKRALFLDMCSECMKNRPQSKITADCVVQLFSFCESRIYFKNICHTSFIENSATSLQSMPIFDTFRTKVVDFLQKILYARNSENTKLGEVQVSRA